MGYLGVVKIDGTSHKVGSTLFGTCATEAATVAKVVTCSDFSELYSGVTIHVKFTYSNTAANPTLNINSKGAKPIYRYGTTAPGTTAETSWNAGAVISFTYDGSNFMMNDWVNTNTNTDTNVTQTATNTNANYEVLFSGTADNTTRTEGARKYSNLTFNPSTGTLTTTKVVSANATLGVADIDTANITEDNVGNLIVTGAARFLNTINGSVSGTSSNVTGTVAIANGGTGATTAANARANLGTPYMYTDSYPTLLPANGSNNWIKIGTSNTSYGLLPSASGGAGSGHNYIGTSSWYWKYAYIDEIHGTLKGNADTATKATQDGSGNVITSTYLKLSGGTMTGIITSSYKSSTWVNSLTSSVVTLSDAEGSFGGWICGPTKDGRIAISSYQASDNKLHIGYGERGRTTNSYAREMTWDGVSGALSVPGTIYSNGVAVSLEGHTHNYAGSSSAGGSANSLANFQVSTSTGLALENTTNIHGYVSGLTKADWNYQQVDGAIYAQFYSASWKHQIFGDYRTGHISLRGKNNGTWQNWLQVLDSGNIGYNMTSTVVYNPHTRKFTTSKSTSAWDAQVYSQYGYSDAVYVTFKPNQTNMAMMIGLDSNPSEDANYNKIDYALYCMNNGKVSIYESGTERGVGSPTYAAGDEFKVEYVGGYVRYYQNGTLLREVARSISGKLYMDSSFHGASSCIYDVEFGVATRNATYAENAGKVNNLTVQTAVPANAVFTDTNYYHTTGSWSGLTYTATANGGAGALAFTIPTGTSATTVAVGNHTHATSIATSTGTNQITLAHGGKYAITAGGTSYIFTMPANPNTDQNVNQSATTTANWRKIVLSYQDSASAGTAVTTNTNVVYVTPNAEIQPSTGTIRTAGNLQVSGTVCANVANSSTAGGLSLYSTDPQTYGVIFRGTGNQGKHGYVQSDWATYFTMNSGATTRGWVFKLNQTNGTVASISGAGNAVFNGSVTVGGNATNTSGCRLVYSELGSLDFVFV